MPQLGVVVLIGYGITANSMTGKVYLCRSTNINDSRLGPAALRKRVFRPPGGFISLYATKNEAAGGAELKLHCKNSNAA
tara:strand:+ start:359 stop:595 length:237 start_codon:yes stop_codon:yes gene_type:complete